MEPTNTVVDASLDPAGAAGEEEDDGPAKGGAGGPPGRPMDGGGPEYGAPPFTRPGGGPGGDIPFW